MNGLRPPGAPPSLRQRVLQAASRVQPTPPSIWNWIRQNRPLRAVWALSTLGLLLANVWLSVARPKSPRQEVVDARRQLELLSEELALPDLKITPRAEAMVLGRAADPKTDTESADRVPRG